MTHSVIFSANEPFVCPHCDRVYIDKGGENWEKLSIAKKSRIIYECECGQIFSISIEQEALVTRPLRKGNH